MPDASPTKWHRAHTSWFFEEFVLPRGSGGHDAFDPEFRFLFNSYYEAVGERQPRAERGMITRPDVHRVADYRRAVDEAMHSLLAEGVDEATASLVVLGLHHEQQHQELLLMDAKHLLYQNPLRPAYDHTLPERSGDAPRPTGWIGHGGGRAEIGHHGDGFAFDNEGPRHETFVHPFALADRLVTCGEWLEFMADDGYRRPELWLAEGWWAVQSEGWEAPLYWDHTDDGWSVFTLSGLEAVAPAEPVVHVSYFEADAFARWRDARLPTEAEWEVMAGDPDDEVDGHQLHPQAPDAGPVPQQAFGATWQWTASAYTPYPGFRPAAGAVGEYNGKFMVNQQVLRGSACITSPGHARRTYRNFFPAASRWAFSGVRLATDG